MGLLLNGAGIETQNIYLLSEYLHTIFSMGLLLNGAGIETLGREEFRSLLGFRVWACSLTERALRHSILESDTNLQNRDKKTSLHSKR